MERFSYQTADVAHVNGASFSWGGWHIFIIYHIIYYVLYIAESSTKKTLSVLQMSWVQILSKLTMTERRLQLPTRAQVKKSLQMSLITKPVKNPSYCT